MVEHQFSPDLHVEPGILPTAARYAFNEGCLTSRLTLACLGPPQGYYPQPPQQAYGGPGPYQQGGYAPQPQPQVIYV